MTHHFLTSFSKYLIGCLLIFFTATVASSQTTSSSSSNDDFRHWGISLHSGVSVPHGDINSFTSPGPNAALDLEYRFNDTFSLELIYGFHHFPGDSIAKFDVNVHQASLNGKVYGSSSPVRPFFNFGGGAYLLTPGVSVYGGANVGAGLQYNVSPRFAVEGAYNFHNVFSPGSNVKFSTAQGGVRFRF